MMEWEAFRRKYETVLRVNPELASIRLELYLSSNRRSIFIGVEIFLILFKMLASRFRSTHKSSSFRYVHNIYFLDTSASSCIDNIVLLRAHDARENLLVVNSQAANAHSFRLAEQDTKFINFESYSATGFLDLAKVMKYLPLLIRSTRLGLLRPLLYLIRYKLTVDSLFKTLAGVDFRNIILSNDSLVASNLMVQFAKKRGVQDYVLQQGTLGKFFLPVEGSNYIAWGEIAKKWLDSKSKDCKVLALGAPRLDNLKLTSSESLSIRQHFREKYNVLEDDVLLLYLSHSHAVEFPRRLHEVNFRALMRLLGMPGVRIAIRLHPSENRELFDQIFDSVKSEVILISNKEDIHHAIVSADICASAYSTTLLEAMCLKITTMQMNIAKVVGLPTYSGKVGGILIESHEQLVSALKQTDFSEVHLRQLKLVEGYFSNLGYACARILQYINGVDADIPEIPADNG